MPKATLYSAEEQGLDPSGGKWVHSCDKHGALVNTRSKRAENTEDFCDGCRAEKMNPQQFRGRI